MSEVFYSLRLKWHDIDRLIEKPRMPVEDRIAVGSSLPRIGDEINVDDIPSLAGGTFWVEAVSRSFVPREGAKEQLEEDHILVVASNRFYRGESYG